MHLCPNATIRESTRFSVLRFKCIGIFSMCFAITNCWLASNQDIEAADEINLQNIDQTHLIIFISRSRYERPLFFQYWAISPLTSSSLVRAVVSPTRYVGGLVRL